jgi:hypothetical protein
MKRATGAKDKKLRRMKEKAHSMGWPPKKESWLSRPIPYNIFVYICIYRVYKYRFMQKKYISSYKQRCFFKHIIDLDM